MPAQAAHTQITVLGGGPAGATAARVLATLGYQVLLLTRPLRGPALAESLTPSATSVMEHVGVLAAVNAAGFVRSTGHTVLWGDHDERIEMFAAGALGWQVSRLAFDRMLLREAQKAGARVHRAANVRSVAPLPSGGWQVLYESREISRHVTADWVIDCTGRSGLMSRAKSGRVPASARTMAVVGLWERRPHWHLQNESHTHVESYPGGWAWSVPLSRTRRQITVMLNPRRTDVGGGQHLQRTYRDELASTVMMRQLMQQARPVGAPWARDASSYSCEGVARGTMLLAGDAASFVDPLSSFGIKKAMSSAWLAATVVHSAMVNPAVREAALAMFAERERAMVSGLLRPLEHLSHEAATAHPNGFWNERVQDQASGHSGDPDVAALRDDPQVRRAFEALRSLPILQLRRTAGVRVEARAVVVGTMVQMQDHWLVPAFPSGVRYIRNIDLLMLADVALRHDSVPAILDAYCARAGAAPLADLLGALAVLVGKGMLDIA